MAMKRGAPWWLTIAFVAALGVLFLGERVVGHLEEARLILSGLAVVVLLGATALRILGWAGAGAERRRVERILLLGQLGCVLALVLYLVGSADGARWLRLLPSDPKSRDHVQGAIDVLWPILLACSLLPLVAAQWAVGAVPPTDEGGEARVDSYRVAELATSWLTIGLAAALVFVVCYVASDRDAKLDLSYFRTSMPGTATRNVVAAQDKPLKVLLFFPDVNEVKDEVVSYFDELSGTGKIEIEEHDRQVEPKLAQQYKATKDGTIVIARGEQSEAIQVGTDIKAARDQLRTLDENVNKALMKVVRAQRVAYLTVGHGELNDPESEGPMGGHGEADGAVVKRILGQLNYRVKELGLKDGLAREIPEDATIVLALGPTKPFLAEELSALDRYLEGGGSLLFALDPASEASLGVLEGRLGVKFDKTPLADDKEFFARARNDSDHRLIVTDKFSAHAAVTNLSRAAVGQGILVINSGSLLDAPFAEPEGKAAKRTYVVRSLPSTFADANGNFNFDGDGGEKRLSYNLAAAIEGPKVDKPGEPAAPEQPADDKDAKKDPDKLKPGKKDEKVGMRALVLADSQLFSDSVLMNVRLNLYLVADVLLWLGGEETFSGDTTSEKDIPIEHTRSQDVAWFYSTIIGAPLLVLGFGLLPIWVRRQRRGRKRS